MNSNTDTQDRLNLVQEAADRIHGICHRTELMFSERLSQMIGAEIWIKREDQQPVRSFKLRGALNKMLSLSQDTLAAGVVCASAGNHAQGVAFACKRLKVPGTIFMPADTPTQKVREVAYHGGEFVTLRLFGSTFDESKRSALSFCERQQQTFIHPFDDELVIAGQATVCVEVKEQLQDRPIDCVFVPVGGGGLVAGALQVFPRNCGVTVVGVEPKKAASMSHALSLGQVSALERIDSFVDGAAVQEVGGISFAYCQHNKLPMVQISDSQLCQTLIYLYDELGLICEPAGALSLAALWQVKEQIQGKRIVCILSGSNSGVSRIAEIQRRAMGVV